jgi:NADH-quinone oxidoreductase subunit K
MTATAAYLAVGVVLFSIGLAGVLTRKNLLIILMSIEVMLNGVNVTLVAYSRYYDDSYGQTLVLFAMLVTAAEVAVALVMAVGLYREKGSLNVDLFHRLKG